MNRRILPLIIPLALVLAGVAIAMLQPREEAPPLPAPEVSVPSEQADVEEESVPKAIPVVATAPSETATALKAAEAPATATMVIEGVSFPVRAPEGATIEEAMAALKAEGALSYTLRSYSGLGAFVKEIQGKSDTSDYYWILYVNGKKSATGISATRISSGDVIEWKYEHKY